MEELEKLAKRLSKDFIKWREDYTLKKDKIVLKGFNQEYLKHYHELTEAMRNYLDIKGVNICVEFSFEERGLSSSNRLNDYIINLDFYLENYFKQQETSERQEERSVAD